MKCGGPLHDGPVSPQYCFPLQGRYGNNQKLSPAPPISKLNSTLTSNNLLTIQVQSSVGLRENERAERKPLTISFALVSFWCHIHSCECGA